MVQHLSYSKAPLPFIGKKHQIIKQFRQTLNSIIPDDGQDWTIIDVFGGSGLLSQNAKHLKPQATVIYNDFDGYSQRLQHIADTNQLRQIIIQLVTHTPRQKRITGDIKQKIIDTINSFDGYLDGLEIVNESFETLMPKYYDHDKTLFILDPPYLRTKQEAYGLGEYFGMVHFLKLMRLVRPPYLFFSSTKSEFLSYMDYLQEHDTKAWQRVGGFTKFSFSTHINKNSQYEDNMIYKE